MGAGGRVGRVGGLALALEVGAAVATGWACGAASADEPSSASPGKAVSSSQNARSQPKVGPENAELSSTSAAAGPRRLHRQAKTSAGLLTVDRLDSDPHATRLTLTRATAPKSVTQALPTTAEVVDSITKRAAPTVASSPAAVQNSLTYTAGPTLQDQFTLGFLHILRALSDITGVDLFFKVNSLLESNSPPAILTLGLDTRRTTYTTDDGVEWQVWEIHPQNPTDKTVIALHGGGYISRPNLLHWIDYTTMARDTGATVIVPLYPLATTEAGRATVVVPDVADFISAQIGASGGAQNVSLYADSAGSTYAIAAVRQLLLDGKPVPSSMVLLSLAVDYSLSNPDILKVHDPIFNIKNLGAYDSHFADGIDDVQHSLISPLFYDPDILKQLPPTTIYVGQNEILYPDTLLLHEQAVLDDAPISVVVGTGLPHDWPSGGVAQYTQTAAVRPDVYRELGLIQ